MFMHKQLQQHDKEGIKQRTELNNQHRNSRQKWIEYRNVMNVGHLDIYREMIVQN